MAETPKNLRSLTEEHAFEITWSDSDPVAIPFRYLRGRCPCATCVNEFSGERMVDVVDIPVGIQIAAAQLVGNYAVKFTWNDKHDTGLYTWEHLRELCDQREWE